MSATVTLETAKMLRSAGYNVRTKMLRSAGYNVRTRTLFKCEMLELPSIHEVVEWLRETKGVHIIVFSDLQLKQWRAGLQIRDVTQVVELSDESWPTHDAAVEETIKFFWLTI